MADTDPVAAWLDNFRRCGEVFGETPWADVSRLLAAVEAVLKLAGQLEPQGPASSALEEDRMWIRQECADMIREAITAELLGKGDTRD